MPRRKDKAKREEWKEAFLEDRDFLKEVVQEVLQEILEVEMEETLQAGKGERTPQRLGYRAGETYPKSCVWTSLNHIKGHWVSHHKSERSAV